MAQDLSPLFADFAYRDQLEEVLDWLPPQEFGHTSQCSKYLQARTEAYKVKHKAEFAKKWLPSLASFDLSDEEWVKAYDFAQTEMGKWGNEAWKRKAADKLGGPAEVVGVISMASIAVSCYALIPVTLSLFTLTAAAGIWGLFGLQPISAIRATWSGLAKIYRDLPPVPLKVKRGLRYYYGFTGGTGLLADPVSAWMARQNPKAPNPNIAKDPKRMAQTTRLDNWGRLGMLNQKVYAEACTYRAFKPSG